MSTQRVYNEQRVPIARVTGNLTTGDNPITIPLNARQMKIYVSTTSRAGINQSATTAPTNTAAIWTLTAGDATGGTFTMSWGGQTTAANAYNISAATLKTNLNAITSINSGVASTSGGALNSAPIVITLDGTTLAGKQVLPTIDGSSLTGGVSATTRVPTIATTTAGVAQRAKLQAGTEEIWDYQANATIGQSYLWLTADSGTGTFAVSFYA